MILAHCYGETDYTCTVGERKRIILSTPNLLLTQKLLAQTDEIMKKLLGIFFRQIYKRLF